jgi:hypothetical protein
MKKHQLYQALLLILASFFTLNAFAWDHSIELGYGVSHDPNHDQYNNSGFLLSGDIYPFRHTPYTYWSLNAALGQWHSSAPVHRNLNTAAVSLALRYYPFMSGLPYSPYLLGSIGPALLSTRHFGLNTQGANLAFQVNAGAGMEFFEKVDANFRISHYSNAYIFRPDQGFTVLYMFSMGYLF